MSDSESDDYDDIRDPSPPRPGPLFSGFGFGGAGGSGSGGFSGGEFPPHSQPISGFVFDGSPPQKPRHHVFGRSLEQKVSDLVDMGYSEDKVREVLGLVDGKFDDALQLLLDSKVEEQKWQEIPKELLEEPKKPKEDPELERQTTMEMVEEIEFQTKKRKFEEATEQRNKLIKENSNTLNIVTTIYDRFRRAMEHPPPGATPDQLLQWYQTQVQNELRTQRDQVQMLEGEIKLQNDMNEREAQKQKLVEIDYQDQKLAREYDKTQMQSGIRMSLEDRNMRYLGDQYEFKKMFDCEVCLTDNLDLSSILVFKCGHFWCLNCVKRYLEDKIANGHVLDMKCMRPDCKYMIEHEDVRLSVSKDVYEKYDRFLVEGHLRADPDCKWCPKADCNTAMLRNPKSPMMKCPSCEFEFCFNCETQEWHSGVSCQQFQQWKVENGEANIRYDKWKRDHTKKCPKCGVDVEKNGGCDHMTCSQCKYQWYWSSGAPYP